MTTEELARRFCELVGWEYTPDALGHYGGLVQADGYKLLYALDEGWRSVGIVVDEMRRRGSDYVLESEPGIPFLATFLKRDATGAIWQGDRWQAEASSILDAVLAAANVALEAEAGR